MKTKMNASQEKPDKDLEAAMSETRGAGMHATCYRRLGDALAVCNAFLRGDYSVVA